MREDGGGKEERRRGGEEDGGWRMRDGWERMGDGDGRCGEIGGGGDNNLTWFQTIISKASPASMAP